jgi:hypothetical protein
MTMKFRDINASLITLLGAAEAGRYRTIGYQERAKSGAGVLDSLRTVEVFYVSGEFPKSAGSQSGPLYHNIIFKIDLTASKGAEGNLTALNNPDSTAAQVSAALSTFQQAAKLADDSLNELIDIVIQTIMATANTDLGWSSPIADRWIDNVEKHQPITHGEVVVITASIQLSCAIDETIVGDESVTLADIDTEFTPTSVDEEDTDDTTKTGVKVLFTT